MVWNRHIENCTYPAHVSPIMSHLVMTPIYNNATIPDLTS